VPAQGGHVPTLEIIWGGMAHPEFSSLERVWVATAHPGFCAKPTQNTISRVGKFEIRGAK